MWAIAVPYRKEQRSERVWIDAQRLQTKAFWSLMPKEHSRGRIRSLCSTVEYKSAKCRIHMDGQGVAFAMETK